MQQELDAANLPVPVKILGVNQNGFQVADYDATFCNGRDIPFLEEGPDYDVWAAWNVRYRDVVILDEDNVVIGVYNLSDNNLAEAANYEALRDLLITHGGGTLGAGGAGGAGGAAGSAGAAGAATGGAGGADGG